MTNLTLTFSQQRLLEAITNCRIYQTRQLLETGTPAEFLDEQGYSPLLRACFIDDEKRRTRTNLIKLLVLYGADVNTADPQGRHALTYACMTENQDIVQLLLDISIHNIDLNKRDLNGDTPLMHAVRLDSVNIVTILVDAMNKFRINMDVRNNADRTPYLEAKYLGMMECAEILLQKGNASTDVQVNPFLDFTGTEQEKCQYRGDVRGVEWKKESKARTKDGDENHHSLIHHCQNRSRKSISKREVRVLSNDKRLLKRKCSKPRVLKSKNTEKKTATLERKSGCNAVNKNTCVKDILREIQVCNEKNELQPDDLFESSTEVTKENKLAKETIEKDGRINFSDPPFLGVRPLTAATTRRELKDVKNRENRNPLNYDTFMTDGTPVPPAGKGKFLLRHPRSRTAPPRRFAYSRHLFSSPPSDNQPEETCSLDGIDTLSWHSHFSVHISPSVNFMNKIMSMHAEQNSPESSYRKGVKLRKSEEPNAPTIVEPSDIEHDKHSDGRRSSSGSVRSQTGSLRNRKFTAITRTVASYVSSRKATSVNRTAKN